MKPQHDRRQSRCRGCSELSPVLSALPMSGLHLKRTRSSACVCAMQEAVQEAAEQAARTPLGVLHSVLTDVARRFVLLEVRTGPLRPYLANLLATLTPSTENQSHACLALPELSPRACGKTPDSFSA